jgi:hypothetical protein
LVLDETAARREVNLLDPNWLTGAIYRILDKARAADQNGEFLRQDLNAWLDPDTYPPFRHEFILDMMQDSAIGLCFRVPNYAPAYAYQAYTVQRGFTLGWGDPRGPAALDLALDFADRGVALEPELSLCMIRQALVLALSGRHDEAVEVAGKAARANPCDAACRASYGEVLSMAGSHGMGVAELRIALSLDPFCNGCCIGE